MANSIFLSSTSLDTTQYREAVLGIIQLAGLQPVAMEKWSSAHVGAVAASLAKLDTSDLYLGIFGFYRGTEIQSNGDMVSITEYEYDHACRGTEAGGLPAEAVAIYVPAKMSKAQVELRQRAEQLEGEADLTPEEIDQRLARQDRFVTRVLAGGVANPFRDNTDLVLKTGDQLRTWIAHDGSLFSGDVVADQAQPAPPNPILMRLGLAEQLGEFGQVDQSRLIWCFIRARPACQRSRRPRP